MTFPKILKIIFVPVISKNTPKEQMFKYLREVDVKMANAYSTALGTPYETVFSMDGEYGRRLENGSYTGAIGMLQREQADFAISTLALTDERMQVVKFSFPYSIDAFTFTAQKPDLAPKFLTIIYPYTLDMWLSILTFFITMSIVFYLVGKKRYAFQTVLLKTFGNFLNQDPPFQPRSLSDRFFLLSWSYGVMFLSYSYSAVLLSFLTLPLRETGIRTIPQLAAAVADGRYECATYSGNFIPGALQNSKEEYLKLIGREVNNNLVLVSETDVTVLRTKPKTALIAPRGYVSHLRHRVFISEDNFFPVLFAVPFKRSFCCSDQLSIATLRILSAGLHRKIVDDNNFKASLTVPNDDAETHDSLDLEDISGAFAFLLIGYTLSFLAFVIERIIYKFNKS